MNEKYILKLIVQYTKATYNQNHDNSEFIEWLSEYIKVTKEYSEYIDYLGIDLNSASLAEVEKGYFDSIVSENTSIISTYGDTLNKENSQLVINDNDIAILKRGILMYPDEIELFITHNPYSSDLINNWDKIHNNLGKNICIGIYGKIYDKNIKDKIELIKQFKTKLNNEIKINYDTKFDNIFCTIISDRNKLVKRKVYNK